MRRSRPWIIAATFLVMWSPAAPSAAAPATASTAAPATTTTTVRSVRLDSADAAAIDGAATAVRNAQRALTAARKTAAKADAADGAAAARTAQAGGQLAAMSAEERSQIALLERARSRVRDLAVSSYVSGGSASPLNVLLDAQTGIELAQRQEIVTTVATEDLVALRRYAAAQRAASAGARRALDALHRAQDQQRGADAAAAAADALAARRTSELADQTQLLQLVTAAAAYPGTDIPRLVLDAYRRAAATVQQQGCALPWAALAGIGKVESDHGRAHAAQLTIAGDLVPTIIGPALTGRDGTAYVPDSDNGRYDGDTVYEHAIGPMQFLASTWQVVGRDGNGDGVADPNNIYDAALSAATYLCRAAPPAQLDTDDALRQAFYSYNHADSYVEEVLALTHVYAVAWLGG